MSVKYGATDDNNKSMDDEKDVLPEDKIDLR